MELEWRLSILLDTLALDCEHQGHQRNKWRHCLFMDWTLGPFEKATAVNPCLFPDPNVSWPCPISGPVSWEAKDVFNPAAVVKDGQVCLLYRAEDAVGSHLGTSRIGLAVSSDGLRFAKHPAPVLYPDQDEFHCLEWDGGCEDPRVVELPEGGFLMTYTAWDGSTARLCLAFSDDLRSWRKHGQAFRGRFKDLWSKSGSIVTQVHDGRPKAVRIRGRFWMYWGESNLYLAYSEDLVGWEIVCDDNGQPRPVMSPRPGMFDSLLVEPGPPALLTDKGVLLLYNSANADCPGLAYRSYAPGQALFDSLDPAAMIARSDQPFLTVQEEYEEEGQVPNVVFVEGLVLHQGRWLLFYGTADSLIGVASASG